MPSFIVADQQSDGDALRDAPGRMTAKKRKGRETQRSLDAQARRAKGIPKEYPWAFLDRKEPALRYMD